MKKFYATFFAHPILSILFSFFFCNSIQAQQAGIGIGQLTVTRWDNTNFSLTASGSGWTSPTNTVTTSTSDYASISVSGTALSSSTSNALRVKDNNHKYSSNNYVGFNLSFPNTFLTSRDVTIILYNNGSQVQSKVVSCTYNGGISQEIGIFANQEFDEIGVTLTSPALSTTAIRVNHAFQRAFFVTSEPNTPTSITFPQYAVELGTANTTTTGLGTLTNPERALNANSNEYASLGVLLAGSASVSVKSPVINYDAGTFAGFDISNTSVLGLSLLGNITITTYLDGNEREVKSGNQGGNLIAVGLLTGSTNRIGFVTGMDFDEVRITVASLGVDLGVTRVHNAVMERYSAGPELECNEETTIRSPQFPVYINNLKTGLEGLVTANGSVSDAIYAIDDNPLTSAKINIVAGLGSTATLSVKDQLTTYDKDENIFVGFDISHTSLINLSFLDNISVVTYLDGARQDSVSGSADLLGIGTSILTGSGRKTVGFMATQDFNEVKIRVTNVLGINLGTTNIHGLVLKRFCSASALVCNVETTLQSSISAGSHPVIVNGENTGIDAITCIGCEISNSQNVLDADPTKSATISLVAGIGANASISVKNVLSHYDGGTFAGFEIQVPSLIGVDILSGIRIRTYLNGGEQEDSDNLPSALISVPTSLLTGVAPKQIIGFVTSVDFDEVQITLTNTISLSIGTTNIYGAVVKQLCDVPLVCSTTTALTSPAMPVVINSQRTGTPGVVCAGCEVNNVGNVINATLSDFATISVGAGAGNSASISVLNPVGTYPAGTFAGFTIRDPNSVLQLSLLNSIIINTYNDGNPVQTATGAELLELNLLLPIFGQGSGIYNVGLLANEPFDEVQITVFTLAGALNLLHVYGAFADTRLATVGGSFCSERRIHPDFSVTLSNETITRDLSTNDNVPSGTTYSQSAAGASNPSGATFLLNSNGTYSFSAATAGVYNYTIAVCALNEALPCATSLLQITVLNPASVTNPLIVNPDYATVIQGTTLPLNVLANDGSGNVAQILNPASVSVPAAGIGAPAHGSIAINPITGAISYTASAGYEGRDSLRYTVCDNSSTPICGSTWVFFNVVAAGAANTTTVVDDFFSGFNLITGNVLDNDSDPEGDVQEVAPEVNNSDAAGTLSVSSDGTLAFSKASNFLGGPIAYTYRVVDNGAPQAFGRGTVQFIVNPMFVLPITLKDFQVVKSGHSVNLNWVSATEINASKYIVERSFTGTGFSEIKTIPAKGAGNYTTTDNSLPPGKVYYRLKLIDLDGSFSYSEIRSVLIDSEVTMKVFPNPVTNGTVYLAIGNYTGKITVQLTDLAGRAILQQEQKVSPGNLLPISMAGVEHQMIFILVTGERGERLLHAKLIVHK